MAILKDTVVSGNLRVTDDVLSNNVEARKVNTLITGAGTAGQAGSASVAYIPSLWRFDLNMTPKAGDKITIKIPVAGNTSGVWVSVNNGTTYYPVATNNTGRLTTHYPVNEIITLAFEENMTTAIYGTSISGAAAGASVANYTSNRWVVANYYDSGNTNTNVTQTATTTNATYEVLFSYTADNTTRTEGARKTNTLTYNPSTKLLTCSGSMKSNGKDVLFGTYSASTAPTSPVTGQIWLKDAPMSIEEAKVLVVTSSSVSSLPTTISNSSITADMEVLKSELSNPATQNSDLTVTTAAGSVTISGTLGGSTTIRLWLMRGR